MATSIGSSGEGRLTVSRVDERTLAVEYRDSRVTISRRYVFSSTTDRKSERQAFLALDGFSGVGVTTSVTSGTPTSWRLTPLKGAFVRLDRDCAPVLNSVAE
jgi:hypothetical protein